MNNLDIAILSDLHAFDDAQGKEDPSYLSTSLPDNEPGKHPIAALVQLIEQSNLKASLVLCPGDLGDRARPAAIKYAWASVQRISKMLNSEILAVATGNHDCDSRHAYNKYDAKGVLQSLEPPYPLALENHNDKYWARNFACIEQSHYRLIVLNSSAYHGYGDAEYEHGRIADSTIERIKNVLSTSEPKPVNILLCHHHPQTHSELGLGEKDIMANGQQLLDLLASGDYGAWIVVHGHKHHPKLSYANGGGAAPTVFAAGSLCAILKPPLSSSVKNQFYIMSIPLDLIDKYGLIGTIKSWDWAPGKGWLASAAESQLPPLCGFGHRTNPVIFANEVAAAVKETMDWDALCKQLPQIRYLIPHDMEVLRKKLKESHKIDIVADQDGLVKQIGRFV